MNLKNIYFFLPCKCVGGSQYLFIRYAKAMAKYSKEYNVFYVDYTDGFARTQITENSGITFVDYSDDVKVSIPSESVVINTLNHVRHFDSCIDYDKNKTLLLFWCVSCFDVYINRHLLTKSTRKEIGRLLSTMSKNGQICYLNDSDHYLVSLQYIPDNFVVNTLPILIEDKWNRPMNDSVAIGNPVRFCWLGRIDSDKLNDILSYINDLKSLSRDLSLSLTLIGLGDRIQYVQDYIKKIGFPVNFMGELLGEALDDYIKNNTDIGLASGTSSLEFSLRAKPTIQLWKAEKPYKAGECKRYHLPEYEYDRTRTTEKIVAIQGQNTFRKIFDLIYNDYKGYCSQAYLFAQKHFPENGALLLKERIDSLQSLNLAENQNQLNRLSKMLSVGRKRMSLISSLKSKLFKK